MSGRIGQSLQILQHVAAQADGVAADAVIDAFGLSRRVGQRILSELVELAYLSFQDGEKRADGGSSAMGSRRLVLGPSALAFAGRVERSVPFSSIARRSMRELVQAASETVAINAYSPALAAGVCVAVEEGPHSLGYVIEAGEVKPLHAGASGKTLMAGLTDIELEHVLHTRPLKAVTPRTVTDAARLREDIRAIRAQGFCMTRGERIPGAVGIGVPLKLGGPHVAALVITIPEFRFVEEKAGELVGLVKAKALAIEAALSGAP